jgi:hypothetical protein
MPYEIIDEVAAAAARGRGSVDQYDSSDESFSMPPFVQPRPVNPYQYNQYNQYNQSTPSASASSFATDEWGASSAPTLQPKGWLRPAPQRDIVAGAPRPSLISQRETGDSVQQQQHPLVAESV